ncbi:MAG TPA: hypothetical protein DEG17_09610 [Cyanobacteria bacterium UBA11149]|nr:hypothetical protein [Cyanobacteria bacterium UBA11367]HBE57125.1 hypothetical protein [Cyanobacteria bacterium UBA11366]HBK64413.1 hypothetical protein [Cyanobacteria bacterium UBA11166]HBR75770.1 hypothetical protein [Cyanobacteria bacterium UBA11159]HBS69812.1 hypothetical protein [Cyanobacteria bacterium UBA11153]HBW89104.1 hypothetical protein [Cyanobacteria bacterium UBA11149]HCA96974.1 hypothetical protein [Cyanobacteria bacterium UBA9226]
MNQDNSPDNLENSVQVTGSLEIPKMEKINFSESELLEIYNHVPQILTKKALQVGITKDSIHRTNNVPILLETQRKGSYWIIAIEESNYLLLPKSNLIINPHSYQTVKLLFNCHGYEADNTREFTLNKPAKVSPMPNPQQWKLEEMGVLDFSNISLLSQLQLELQQTNQNYQQLQSQLAEVTQNHEQSQSQLAQIHGEKSQLISQLQESNQELQQFQSQSEASSVEKSLLISQLQQSHQEIQQLYTELDKYYQECEQLKLQLSQAQIQSELSQTQQAVAEIEKFQFQKERAKISLVKEMWVRSQSQIAQLQQDCQELQSQLDQFQVEKKQLQNQLEESQSKLTTLQSQLDKEVPRENQSPEVNPNLYPNSEEAKIVDFYLKNSDLLSEYAIEVSETEESLNRHLLGKNQPVIFQKSYRGFYWIVTLKKPKYLIPKPNIIINESNLNSFKQLFECHGHFMNNSKFKLLKPAKVSRIDGQDKWLLTEAGILVFYLEFSQ